MMLKYLYVTHNLRSIKYESIDFISDKNLIKLFMTQCSGSVEIKKIFAQHNNALIVKLSETN